MTVSPFSVVSGLSPAATVRPLVEAVRGGYVPGGGLDSYVPATGRQSVCFAGGGGPMGALHDSPYARVMQKMSEEAPPVTPETIFFGRIRGIPSTRRVSSPDALKSGGVGPCIAIAVYDPLTQSGYMMHEASFILADLGDTLRKIERDYGGLKRLKVCAFGSGIPSSLLPGTLPDLADRILEIRAFVEATLREYFDESQIKTRWLEKGWVGELFLHTSSGQFYCYEHVNDDGAFVGPHALSEI